MSQLQLKLPTEFSTDAAAARQGNEACRRRLPRRPPQAHRHKPLDRELQRSNQSELRHALLQPDVQPAVSRVCSPALRRAGHREPHVGGGGRRRHHRQVRLRHEGAGGGLPRCEIAQGFETG